MNFVLCPHCGKQVEISQALKHQLKEEVAGEFKSKHVQELEKQKEDIKKETELRFRKEFEFKFKDSQNESEENKKKAEMLQSQLLEMTKLIRQLKDKDQQRELEMHKKLASEEEKIRQEEQKKAEEAQHLKILEKDKQLQDTLKELEDAKRKLTQGSQQNQGEVFELSFEQMLQQQYPHDKIMPVGKGIKGADIVQEVWDSNGKYAGKIIWELKNTRTWSEPWIDKLKADKRAINADEAVLITEAMPGNIKVAGFRNGVWVTQRNFVLPLTDSLRVKLIQQIIIKNSLKGKDVKMEALYAYLTGTEFKNRIEAIIEAFTNMQQEVEKEKRYFSNKWARDEKNIRQVIDSTYGMHGDLKGILAAAVPQIQGLELLEEGK